MRSQMRAAFPASAGGPEVLTIGERPVPQPGAGQILIKVAFAGVNRHDCNQRQRGAPPAGATDILGLEVSGEIAARCDLSGDFEAKNVGGASWRRASLTLIAIMAVHACEGDLDENLSGARLRNRPLSNRQNLWPAGGCRKSGAHLGSHEVSSFLPRSSARLRIDERPVRNRIDVARFAWQRNPQRY